MSEPILIADGVTYQVGDITLVDNVNLVGHPGEVVAILGPNGAGKTTLLRLLAGDLLPDAGSLTVNEIDTRSAVPLELAKVRSVMRQGGVSDIPFTALAVVEMGRHPHRTDDDVSRASDRSAIRSAMERTDTLHLAARTFATLSGGEQTRVVMARVFAQAAPIVLLDEPTTALDVAHQERVLYEMKQLAAERACVVAVLHDLNSAAFHADRIVLMDRGTVRAEGSPDEVLRADLLSEVYRQSMTVVEHPTRGCPLVLIADGVE
ncbi:MAG: heme ABC transporter ATP-binding protein [Actinomycetota bacterium]